VSFLLTKISSYALISIIAVECAHGCISTVEIVFVWNFFLLFLLRLAMPNYVHTPLQHHSEFEMLHEERSVLRTHILELETKLEKIQALNELNKRQRERIAHLEAEVEATHATLRQVQDAAAVNQEEFLRLRERFRRSELSNRRLLETLTENEQLYLTEMNAMRRSLLEAQAARRSAEAARGLSARPRPLSPEFLKQHPKVIPFRTQQSS
jgi:hypothetical protein